MDTHPPSSHSQPCGLEYFDPELDNNCNCNWRLLRHHEAYPLEGKLPFECTATNKGLGSLNSSRESEVVCLSPRAHKISESLPEQRCNGRTLGLT